MYFGQDPNQQLATLLANPALASDYYFGLDDFSGDDQLEANSMAADMMFAADPTPQNAQIAAQAKTALVRTRAQRMAGPAAGGNLAAVQSAAMQNLQRQALARSAGKVPFAVAGEDTTAVKTEILPIPVTHLNPGQTLTIAVRPIRSMQVNSIIFPSLLPGTAVCRVNSIQILGLEQLNGSGGVHCSGLTEVRTARIMKGSTAQAGQDVTLSITNTDLLTVAGVDIEGWFEGPDLVRVT